jgi:hypothetical protein
VLRCNDACINRLKDLYVLVTFNSDSGQASPYTNSSCQCQSQPTAVRPFLTVLTSCIQLAIQSWLGMVCLQVLYRQPSDSYLINHLGHVKQAIWIPKLNSAVWQWLYAVWPLWWEPLCVWDNDLEWMLSPVNCTVIGLYYITQRNHPFHTLCIVTQAPPHCSHDHPHPTWNNHSWKYLGNGTFIEFSYHIYLPMDCNPYLHTSWPQSTTIVMEYSDISARIRL